MHATKIKSPLHFGKQIKKKEMGKSITIFLKNSFLCKYIL